MALDLGFGTGLEIKPVTYLHSLQPLRKTVIFSKYVAMLICLVRIVALGYN